MNLISLSKEKIHCGNLILVNRRYGCPRDGTAPLTAVREREASVLMQRRAAVLLARLLDDIRACNEIVLVSGWRAFQEQREIWGKTLAESGVEFAQKYVAIPGCSEHQTGLAVDLGLRQSDIDLICPHFPYDGICQTFREKAPEYGFVERYPMGKEKITGIEHEPWHFRYVGMPHAKIMTEIGLVLEEYIDFMKQFPYGKKAYHIQTGGQEILLSYVKAGAKGTAKLEIDKSRPYSVSGNNVDGFIITQWEKESLSSMQRQPA